MSDVRVRVSRPRLTSILMAVVVVALIVLPPLYVSAPWLRVGSWVMVGAVAGIGLTMLTGHAGQLTLGTPFFMLVGATAYCVFGDDPAQTDLVAFGLPSLLALVAAVLTSAIAGLLFAPVAGRVRGIYLAVASLSLVYLGLYLGQRWEPLTGGSASGRRAPELNVLGISLTGREPELVIAGTPLGPQERIWILFGVLTLVAFVMARRAVRSRAGRAWRALRDNEASAQAMGIHPALNRSIVFAVSSAYAGLAGVMTVTWFSLLKADENEFEGTWSIAVAISLLAVVLIGGLGSIAGAVWGSALVFGLPLALQLIIPQSEFLSDLLSGANGLTPVVLTTFIYGLAIVGVVMFEPGGLARIARRLQDTLTLRISKKAAHT